MAQNIQVFTARVAKVPTMAQSQKNGQPLDRVNMTLVEDTPDGPKWYDAVAFGPFSKLVYSKLSKGSEAKFVGPVTVNEYEKKDGGIGTSLKVVINKVVLEGGLEIDKFSKAPDTVAAKTEEKTEEPF